MMGSMASTSGVRSMELGSSGAGVVSAGAVSAGAVSAGGVEPSGAGVSTAPPVTPGGGGVCGRRAAAGAHHQANSQHKAQKSAFFHKKILLSVEKSLAAGMRPRRRRFAGVFDYTTPHKTGQNPLCFGAISWDCKRQKEKSIIDGKGTAGRS